MTNDLVVSCHHQVCFCYDVKSEACSGAYLHVIHHQFVAELGPVLGIRHLLVHQGVQDRQAAVGAERGGHLFIELCEMGTRLLVAQLGHPDHVVIVADRETQDVPAQTNQSYTPAEQLHSPVKSKFG